jgi:hypothetical protein
MIDHADRAEPELATALGRLITRGTLSDDQASAVRAEFHAVHRSAPPIRDAEKPARGAAWSTILSELGGYVGAAFVFGAAVALVGPEWEHFSRAERVLLLAVPALLLLIGAVATALAAGLARPDHQARERLVGALVIVGGGLLAGAAAAGLEAGGDERWVPVVALAVWGAGYLLRRGALLQVATASALFWSVLVVPPDLDRHWPLTGGLLFLTGAIWAALTAYGLVAERPTGFTVAAALAFVGGEAVALADDRQELGYVLLVVLAAAGLGGYARTRELSALAAGALGLVVVVPQAIIDYTEDSMGAAGALLVSGLSVVAVSVLVTRLHGRPGRGSATPPESAPAQLV